MVLYMALQYWVSHALLLWESDEEKCSGTKTSTYFLVLPLQRLQSLYGLTEITCWACRLFINVSV